MRFYPSDIAPFDLEPTGDRFVIRTFFSDIGEGVVARVPFRRRELVARFFGEQSTHISLYTLQLRPGVHLHDPWFVGKLLHSCEPNLSCDMERQMLIARCNIDAGDKLTLDYEATEDELFRAFNCQCGRETCRGRIAGRKHRVGHASEIAFLDCER